MEEQFEYEIVNGCATITKYVGFKNKNELPVVILEKDINEYVNKYVKEIVDV